MGCGSGNNEFVQIMEQLVLEATKLTLFVNGTENQTVDLGGVATDTIRRMVDSFKRGADGQLVLAENAADRAEFAAGVAVNAIPAIVTEGNAQVERVRSEGQAHTEAACACAEDACVCAQEARQAVASIPGIEAAQYTVNAFSIVEGQLVWFQGREGDVMRAADYDLALGPEHSQIYYSLNNGGELVRHIPVAPPAI